MTSEEADYTTSADMDPTINTVEVAYGSPQPADSTNPTDNPQLDSRTAAIQPHGDVQLSNGADLAAPL